MMIAAFVCAVINGRLPETVEAMMNGAKESVFTLLSFAGVMCFWTGILKIGEGAGLMKAAERVFSPVIRLLFPKAGKRARELMTMNISANLLGMGNAATPMGVKAMAELDKENKKPERPSRDMCMFTILNTSSLTLFPSTVIALRAAAGSAAPQEIIFPIWCASVIPLLIGILLVRIFIRE